MREQEKVTKEIERNREEKIKRTRERRETRDLTKLGCSRTKPEKKLTACLPQ